jgi:hypothetical protein
MSRLVCLGVVLGGTSLVLADSPALTIYNQNFGVVRETISLDLKQGENQFDFSGVTAMLEPDSVILRDPTDSAQFRILEQNYRNDPASVGLLLQYFEGREIDFLAPTEEEPDRILRGKIIRSGYTGGGQPIIEVGGQIRFGLPGQPLFPSLSDDSILLPTLSWLIQSQTTGTTPLQLSYVTSGLTWSADYNLVAPEKGDVVDLIGWITMNNETGRTFENARFKLVAGDVSKIQDRNRLMKRQAGYAMAARAMDEETVTEKSFDDFHLYTITRQTTLRDQQSQQVEFVRVTGVKAPRVYLYDGASHAFGGYRNWYSESVQVQRQIGGTGNKKVWIVRELENAQDNSLGMPLPAGRVRFYRADDDGLLEFTGENEIDHTPKDETIRLYTGNAFDLVGERTQTEFQYDQNDRWIRESYRIQLRNRKEEPVTIRVVEHLFRWSGWKIQQSSHEYNKKDSRTVEFDVKVPAGEEVEVTYTVRYSW